VNQTTTTITLADGTILPDCRRDLLNIADLQARGWSVIPLRPRSKLPAVPWQEYQRRHATINELEQWFAEPGFNVGIVTGKLSGIFVIDADTPEAVAWALSNLPPCDLRVRTSKGMHFYYSHDYEHGRPIRNKARIRDGIDVRAEGGYVVAPGSVHESGHLYTREGEGWRWS
jgi:hypothetical protein